MRQIVMFFIVPTECSNIVIGIPYIARDCVDNGVTNVFKEQDDVLEFIAMFEDGYPNFNIRKDFHG